MEIKEFFDNSNSSDYERKVFYSFVPSLSKISIDKTEINQYFGLFILCDFSIYSVTALSSFAERMINSKVAYASTFGKDCEKMHDIFDEILVYREVVENESFPHIMTTWHSRDTLDEALWFALFTAFPDDSIINEYESILIVVVEKEEWNESVISKLSDIESFNRIALKETDNEQLTINN